MTDQEVGQPEQTQDPEALREDIEETREEVGDTVEALAQKADIKAQVSEKMAARTDDAKRAASQVAHTAEERPFPAIGVALGLGLLVGWLIGRR